MYKLASAYREMRDTQALTKALAQFNKFDLRRNPAGSGEFAKLTYGEMGRYARIIDPFPRVQEPKAPAPPPRFDAPSEIKVKFPEGTRWAKASDFAGRLETQGLTRIRFGQGVATFDADGDGRIDLYLTSAVVGPQGVRDVLLLNRGEGQYEDATAAFGLPLDRAGLGVAAGDFDADRRADLFLAGVGDNRLFRNTGKGFEDVTKLAGIDGSSALSLSARWLDLDQDGDLDLYVVNYSSAADANRAFGDNPPAGLTNAAYRNDGKPADIAGRPEDNWVPLAAATPDIVATKGLSVAFSTAFPGLEALGAGQGRHTAVAALDLDEDRDIDLVVTSDDFPPKAILNDRAGAFHVEQLPSLKPDVSVSGLLVTDLDKDGRPDLVAVGFGISNAAHVQAVGEFADAAIIGSALVALIEKTKPSEAAQAIGEFIRGLRMGR